MKSFSSSSFASDHAEILARAASAVDRDPHALFSNLQWYLIAGQDTVFYSAFSRLAWDKEGLSQLVARMVALAPQMTHGFIGAKPGQPFPKQMLDAITSVETIDSFEAYPDKWLGKSADLFEAKGLPLFRVMAANLRGGPDEKGRASILQVRSAHSLFEGSDSALLTRSQSASHGVVSNKDNKGPIGDRVRGVLEGGIGALVHLTIANLLAPPDKPWGFSTLAVDRQRLRKLAQKFGVTQRSVFFTVVTHALFSDKPNRKKDTEVVTVAYTLMGDRDQKTAQDDDFLRASVLDAKFPRSPDVVEYLMGVEKALAGADGRDVAKFQAMMNSLFRTHRRLSKVVPFLYGPRFRRYSGETDAVLTLIPPHRAYGTLAEHAMEPIYCGAYHPATNIVTFTPGREYITLSFSMEKGVHSKVPEIEGRIAALEAAPAP